jgi:hypothetical protein
MEMDVDRIRALPEIVRELEQHRDNGVLVRGE